MNRTHVTSQAGTSVLPTNNSERIDDDHTECRALGEVLDRVGDKWTIMVVGLLSKGPMRFNVLLRTIGGVSQRMLTLTLRGLERDGLVTRTVFPTIPPRVEYELTEVGHTLISPLRALSNWAKLHRAEMEKARRKFAAKPVTTAKAMPRSRLAKAR